MLSHDACPQWTGVFLFSERWRNPAGYATIFIGEVIHMSEKTVTLHVRITESQKRHLQELAERKGLVLSKIIQNYIEKLLEKELSIPATPSAQARLSKLSFENSTFTLRCSKTLQQLYRAACSQEGLHANGHIRMFMQDFAYLLTDTYPSTPYSTESRLVYLKLFLKNEAQKRGLRYKESWCEVIQLPDDLEMPLIDMVSPFHYVVYDVNASVMWHIVFQSKNEER